MIIEVNGAGFVNKGAELMLRTTVRRFADQDPNIVCVVAAGRDKPPAKVGAIGAQFIWPSSSLFGMMGRYKLQLAINNVASRLVNPERLHPYGLINRFEVDALIDISGYAFGDHWGPGPMKRFIALSDFYKKRNKPVIMLPQMMGPFDRDETRGLFRKLAGNCTLMYARDDVSLEAAKKTAPDANFQLCPDITICSQEPTGATPATSSSNRVCIVPNIRMTDSGTSPWPVEEYVNFLAAVAKQVLAKDHTPVMVLHDALGRDGDLAKSVAEKLDGNIKMFSEPDPKKLKTYISESKFLIGSRFHSLVAALSSGVPVIAIGWAHKYKQLLSDYGQERFNLVGANDSKSCFEMVDELVNDETFRFSKDTIIQKNLHLRARVNDMWQEVFQKLGLPGQNAV